MSCFYLLPRIRKVTADGFVALSAVSFKEFNGDLIVEHLKTVFDAESVDYDDEGLWAIARAGQGYT